MGNAYETPASSLNTVFNNKDVEFLVTSKFVNRACSYSKERNMK
jgi:hypothetical protein